MKAHACLQSVFVWIASLMLCAVVFAADNPTVKEQWQISFTPYFWASEIDGDVTLKGRTGPADVSFSDIMNNLDIAFMGRLEAWRGKWGLFLDGTYMSVESDFSTSQGLISADIDLEMTMLEFGAGYKLWERAVGQDSSQKLSFDLLGGGRFMNVDYELKMIPGGPLSDIVNGQSFERRDEWVDPIIGGRMNWELTKKLALAVRADVGGFSVGEGSDLVWNFLAGMDYRLSEKMTLKAGYRILDIDYSTGSGTNEFGMDTQFRGPILGLSLLF